MKILSHFLHNASHLFFIDLEATGLTHEMIELGAYRVEIGKDYLVNKVYPPFKTYVRAKHPITPIVTRLTGITEETLKNKGVSFPEAIKAFRNYAGSAFRNGLFITFGPHDRTILERSLQAHPEMPPEDVEHLLKHHEDFQSFLKRFIQDEHGNPLSLSKYLKIFNLPFEGQEHDALADAYNLLRLYQSVLERPDVIAEEYEKTLSHASYLPGPLKAAFKRLSEGESLTPEAFRKALEETFR